MLDIDFRDNPYTPKHGVRLFAEQTYSYLTNEKDHFTTSEISLEFYQPSRTWVWGWLLYHSVVRDADNKIFTRIF